jgi:hypothetical protein
MRASVPRHTGVLVVRAWLEDGRNGGLRARITWTADVSGRGLTRLTASGQEQIHEAIEAWLDAVAAGDDSVTGR